MTIGEAGDRLGKRREKWKTDVDGWRRKIFVLDFGFGERGHARRAPQNRLATAIHGAALHQLAELADLDRHVLRVHRQVRILPIGENAEAAEFLALDRDVAARVVATELT